MKSSLMQNPLMAAQNYQQAPMGIPQQVAQFAQSQPFQGQPVEQAPQTPDPSSLADYIKQLQDNGATTEQIQNIISQAQGGESQPQSDTMQGGSGTDTIEGGTGTTDAQNRPPVASGSADQTASQSPLSQALNQMASGQGNINYDQVSGAYPTPRPMLQTSPLDSFANAALRNSNAGNVASVFQAIQAGKEDQMRQQNAAIAQQNQRDLGAFGATTGIAEKAGGIQAQMAQLAREKARDDNTARYQQGELGIRQQNADADKLKPLGTDSEGNAVLYNMKDGSIQKVPNVNLGKPKGSGIPLLSAAQEDQITKASHQLLGLDKSGQPIDSDTLPVRGTDLDKMESAAGILMATGQARTAKQAMDAVANQVKLVGDGSGVFGGDKHRIIADTTPLDKIISMGAPQAAPNVTSPAGAPETIPTGGQLTVANPNSAAPSVATQPIAPKSQQEYDALSSGTKYMAPDGKIRTKP